jgi:hypothetical protein
MRPGDGSLDEAAGPDTGPWPWLFLADEQRVGDGADTLRFAVLNHVPRSNAGHSADLATVSYALESSEAGGYALRRWVQPGVPSDPRRGPPADEAAGAVVAEGLASFSTRFLSEEGDWRTAWDSSAAPDLDRLPMAAEVRVALLDRDAWELDGEEIPGTEYVRTVLMPVRPVDLTPDDEEGDDGTGLDDDGGPLDEDEDLAGGPDDPGDCPFGTVGECVSRNASQLPPGVTADQALDFLNLDSGECAPGPTLSGFGVTISCQ